MRVMVTNTKSDFFGRVGITLGSSCEYWIPVLIDGHRLRISHLFLEKV